MIGVRDLDIDQEEMEEIEEQFGNFSTTDNLDLGIVDVYIKPRDDYDDDDYDDYDFIPYAAEHKELLKEYNIKTAKCIYQWDNGEMPGNFKYYSETLYQCRDEDSEETGEFFLYMYTEDDKSIGIFDNEDDVKTWVENKSSVKTYIKLFGPVEE